jgi:cation diffusion facilitator family transporter
MTSTHRHDDHEHGQGHDHDHDRPHEHEHEGDHSGYEHSDGHGHTHPHVDDGGHAHSPGHDHGEGHDHGHEHSHGFLGALKHALVPHTHDAADSIDDAMEASQQGVRALVISLVVLLVTTVLQFAIVLTTQSVALLADTVHNFSDALTAVPLMVAFFISRRPASRRYTYGYGRSEDLAGLFIVVVVLLSAVVAAWQSIDRLIHPHTVQNLGWLAVAGVIGFLGNESVAIYRIRIGRRIGSAALVADGVHARTDGFTSLAVVLGAIGIWLGFPLADPIIGILISIAIFALLIGTVRSIGRRLLDGIDPDLLDTAEHALRHVPGVTEVRGLKLRWVGHRLQGEATVVADVTSLAEADRIATEAEREAIEHLHTIDSLRVRVTAGTLE